MLDAAAFAALPHISVTVQDHGRSRSFTGVAMPLLAARLGAPTGDALRGEALTTTIFATASQDVHRSALGSSPSATMP